MVIAFLCHVIILYVSPFPYYKISEQKKALQNKLQLKFYDELSSKDFYACILMVPITLCFLDASFIFYCHIIWNEEFSKIKIIHGSAIANIFEMLNLRIYLNRIRLT